MTSRFAPASLGDPRWSNLPPSSLVLRRRGCLGEPSDGSGGRWGTSRHAAVRTSEEAAQIRGATLASGAKAMLLSTKPSDSFVLAVISASEKME